MIRIILWAALILAAIWFVKRLLNPPSRKPAADASAQDAPAPMVRCAQCGVHLPRDRALSQEQQWYCSEAHRLQGPASRER
ncbi:PP0621 family protein [Pseudomonas sp. DTU_2021_1001937_2_SI_NGA_ILE_001]|uniref:PP0621 family protein n=1 Tax=Pseudomonas sp. DTU_2021_1001937_2_SI_NGA_ILE_001 TaxID=3077589 RepID=UPI0025F1B1E3|nr:PP0621 family protein [Pseudomonas sp. DTU_2021_1001937_2_SI_NGA_ILE_001]WNW11946.1 PP0621 family protein [Pseudomonas sp. DTU_2021_1001937_2_SI_NGA_ILE_001]